MQVSFLNSIQTKLALFITFIIGLIAVFVYLYFPNRFEEEQLKAIWDKVNTVAEITSISVRSAIYKNDFELVESEVNRITQTDNIKFVVVYDTTGNIIYEHNAQLAFETDYNFSNAKSLSKESIIKVKHPIVYDNKKLGDVYLGYSLDELHRQTNEMKKNIYFVAIFIFVIGFILVFLIGHFISKPLREVTYTAQKISSGDFTRRALVRKNDEVGMMAKYFNLMVEKIIRVNHQLEHINKELEGRVNGRTRELRLEIEERQKIETELRASENELRLIFDNSNDSIYLLGLKPDYTLGKIMKVNEIACRSLGYTKSELLSLKPEKIFSEDRNVFTSDYLLRLRKEKHLISEAVYRTKEGIDQFVEISANIFELNGKHAILAIARDITERKAAEALIKANAEQFRLLFELAPIGMASVGLDGKIRRANQSLCNTLGYNKDELMQKHISELSHPDDYKEEERAHQKLFKGEIEHAYLEKRYFRKDKTMIDTILTTVLLRDSFKKPYQYIIQVIDITNIKETEKELISAKEQAEESDRLKSAFLAQMSHEIRTPVNTILNFISLIKEDVQESAPEEVLNNFSIIDSGSRRLIRTIDSILNMSQLQAGNFDTHVEDIHIYQDVLKGLAQEFRQSAENKGLNFSVNNSCNGELISGDRYSITQLFANLIDNSIKYTNEGKVNINLYKNAKGNIAIEVEDTGIGMSKEFLNKLFEPFSQEQIGYTRKFEGNGLGLALVKNYAKINNAIINIESIKGKGSKFVVEFEPVQKKPEVVENLFSAFS